MSLSALIGFWFVQAKILGAFKLARFAYDRLQRQRVPPFWQDQIDLDMLTVQASCHNYFSLLPSSRSVNRPFNPPPSASLGYRESIVRKYSHSLRV